MSATDGTPKSFEGYVYNATKHSVLIKSIDPTTGFEALIKMANVKSTTSRPMRINGRGMVHTKYKTRIWIPDALYMGS